VIFAAVALAGAVLAFLNRRLWSKVVFGAGATVGLAWAAVEHQQSEPFRWFAIVSAVLLSAYLCIHLRASLIRARFLLLLASFAMMGVAAQLPVAKILLCVAAAGAMGALGGELPAMLFLFQPAAFVPGYNYAWLAAFVLCAAASARERLS
jgi:hypothetical protein